MKTLEEQIKRFKEETGYVLEVKNEKPYYGGDLYLGGTKITDLPENLTIEGDLYLVGTQITDLPENLTVGGNLDLRGTQITDLPDNLTVGGDLDLRGTQITKLPDNLTVGGGLDLRGTQITQLPEQLTVGGSLYLQETQITQLPENLTVGGWLYLQETQITKLPEQLTVVGWLYLRGTQITKLPDNLTVGGGLDLRDTQITDTSNVKRSVPEALHWKGKNKHYIKVDGMFSEVISHKGNLYRIKQIGKENFLYLVTDGNRKWAHGKTLQEAKSDLMYKISNRDKSRFEALSLDDTLTFEEAIEAYRVITGACSAGTRNFIENRLPQPHKEKYSIREIIELTQGEYQSEVFKQFFENAHLSSSDGKNSKERNSMLSQS